MNTHLKAIVVMIMIIFLMVALPVLCMFYPYAAITLIILIAGAALYYAIYNIIKFYEL
jgi:hypothetical protein